MTFAQFTWVEILKIVFVAVALEIVRCLIDQRWKSFSGHKGKLTDKINKTHPKDRLPSKREKRKIKWLKRELASAEEEMGRLKKWCGFINIGFGICLLWLLGIFCISVITEPKEATMESKASTVVETPAETKSETAGAGSEEYSEEHSEGPDLVEEILQGAKKDAYYYKHLSEIEAYTDEFGLDLDRVLNDYGYHSSGYATANGYGKTPSNLTSEEYWTVFERDRNFIAFNSLGGWIICSDSEVTHEMVPPCFEEPRERVSLNERQMCVNRDVLALLFEFLATQPKHRQWQSNELNPPSDRGIFHEWYSRFLRISSNSFSVRSRVRPWNQV